MTWSNAAPVRHGNGEMLSLRRGIPLKADQTYTKLSKEYAV